jgi:phosphopantetheinyl transferase (holo-ACP synthase)
MNNIYSQRELQSSCIAVLQSEGLTNGEAERLFGETGATRIDLSISHTSEHAVAQVILESE